MIPTRKDINTLINEPGWFADAMSISQIDNVIAEFITVREYKMGWYESHA